MSQPQSALQSAGNTIFQSYNAWGQANETIDPEKNLYVTNYDISSNKAYSFFVSKDNIANYRANPTSNSYRDNYIEVSLDQFGRATSRKVYQNWPIASGELSELYSYDIVGNLIGYTDPARKLNEDGYTASYKYDALNRVKEVKGAMNQVTCANYTVLGNVDSVKLKANARDTGSISLYTKAYNELDGVQSKTDSSLQSTVYSYNTIGLNTKIVDRNKSINNFTYDGLNQLKETTQVRADNLTNMGYKYSNSNPFGYDNEQLYINAALAATSCYTYDTSGQITRKQISGSNLIYSSLEMKYKDSGRLERLGVNQIYSTYKYTNNRLTKVQTNGSYAVSSDDSHKQPMIIIQMVN